MNSFSKRSKENLETCHPSLQRLFNEVIKHRDCSVIYGYRNREEQERVFREGKSKARFGESKHNYSPSLAVDVVPYPVRWEDKNQFVEFAELISDTAARMGINVRWGADWDRDGIPWEKENWEIDGPHWELVDNYPESKVTE